MKPNLRIAHCSDIHLDTDYHGGEINLPGRDFYRAVFDRLLTAIAAHEPQLLMLPGDLFDSNRASADTITWAAERLETLPFPVVMIPGNHDCLEDGAIFGRYDFDRGNGMHFLSAEAGERRELPDLQATVWGRGMVTHHPKYRPLEGLPAPLPDSWNLAMGHGIFVAPGGDAFRSSPIHATELDGCGYDYVALGHHHALLNASQNGTTAYYCGAPVPISSDRKGTFLIVDLVEGEAADVTVHTLD